MGASPQCHLIQRTRASQDSDEVMLTPAYTEIFEHKDG